MTPETRMLAASIGKTLVAATVLALESEGRLAPASRLAQHLGVRPGFAGLPNAEVITIDHLHHESGLPDHPHLPKFEAAATARIASDADAFTPKEVLGFDYGGAVAFQINKDAGIIDGSSDVVPALEAGLADLSIERA